MMLKENLNSYFFNGQTWLNLLWMIAILAMSQN
jgi:hypothetical protein